ncbi:MAG: AAA family ATPase, partial [Actinomycetota bacterium]|nr:AAA family ATPase [Actinomycetota bacterium]
MKVTSLDVSNLLSFGEFHLDFDDRLTVLVGPNGAGKTNIVRVFDLVTKLIDWADARLRQDGATRSATEAVLSSYADAAHDESPPGTPMEVRLSLQFTTE